MADNNSVSNNNKFPQLIKKKLLKTRSFIFPPNRAQRASELEVLDEISVLTSVPGDDPKNQGALTEKKKTRITRLKNIKSRTNMRKKKHRAPPNPIAMGQEGAKAFVKIVKKTFSPITDRLPKFLDAPPALDEVEAVYPPLFPQLRESWIQVTANYVSQDLHRLINRVTVKTSGVRNILLEPMSPEERIEGGVPQLAKVVCDLVKLLARRLESEAYSNEIQEIVDNIYSGVDPKTDMIGFNKELFSTIPNFENSCVMKVLKCVHQSLVLKPYGILRTVVLKDKLTKDVRSEDGWQISITLAQEGFIQVKHIRKEQSIDFPTAKQPDKTKNHWEYAWEVSMTFDYGMEEMTASRLTITNLILSEGMDEDLEKDLRTIMNNGELIVFS